MSAISPQSATSSVIPASLGFVFSRQPSDHCIHCGALLAHSNYALADNPLCRVCGCRKYDVKAFCLVSIDGELVSPWFEGEELLDQFADFFHIQKGASYGVQETIHFFGTSRLEQRSAFLRELEQNRILLNKLLALPDKHPSELPYVAAAAGLLGYALPQFQEGYGEEVE